MPVRSTPRSSTRVLIGGAVMITGALGADEFELGFEGSLWAVLARQIWRCGGRRACVGPHQLTKGVANGRWQTKLAGRYFTWMASIWNDASPIKAWSHTTRLDCRSSSEFNRTRPEAPAWLPDAARVVKQDRHFRQWLMQHMENDDAWWTAWCLALYHSIVRTDDPGSTSQCRLGQRLTYQVLK